MKSTSRNVEDRTLLDGFVEDIAGIIDKHCRYVIVSGFVAISHGRSRGTEDIDMIIERINKEQFSKLHRDMIKSGFECVQPGDPEYLYDAYLLDDTSIRYVRKGSFVPELELKLAKDKIDELQLKNRCKLPLTGLDVYFSTIETNIAFKEEFLKSPKDMEDARHLRIIYAEKINEKEIDRIKEMIRALRLRGEK